MCCFPWCRAQNKCKSCLLRKWLRSDSHVLLAMLVKPFGISEFNCVTYLMTNSCFLFMQWLSCLSFSWICCCYSLCPCHLEMPCCCCDCGSCGSCKYHSCFQCSVPKPQCCSCPFSNCCKDMKIDYQSCCCLRCRFRVPSCCISHCCRWTCWLSCPKVKFDCFSYKGTCCSCKPCYICYQWIEIRRLILVWLLICYHSTLEVNVGSRFQFGPK